MKKFISHRCVQFCNVLRQHFTANTKQMNAYAEGSAERTALQAALKELKTIEAQVPVVVGKEEIFTGDEQIQRMPHNHACPLAIFSFAKREHVQFGIREALKAQPVWSCMSLKERAEIWLRCADILETQDRYKLNAAIMLGQGKTYRQAEDDLGRLLNGIRLYARKALEIDECKVKHRDAKVAAHIRPLEGFVACMGPFNWTCESVGLVVCPSLMGSCVLWRPSRYSVLSCYTVMQALQEAGIPRGAINFLPGNGKLFVDTISTSPHLGGVNIAASVKTLQNITSMLAVRMARFKHWPRLSARLGGKNFHLVTQSADVELAAKATIYAAFDYAGQHGISCERLYVSRNIWPELWCAMQEKLSKICLGDVCDFGTDISALINEKSFDRVVQQMLYARDSGCIDILSGGEFCKTQGYFIEPTVVQCQDPNDRLMTEPVPGPMLSVYVYEDSDLENCLDRIDAASHFGLSGSIFAQEDKVVDCIAQKLRMAASNLYVNLPCIGSADLYFPFSGNRMAGTNDLTTPLSALRLWSSAQLIQTTPPCDKKAK